MQNADAAYAALQRAVDHGYFAFERIEQDSDLAWLRARPDYRAKLAELEQDPGMLTGYVGVVDVREDVVYTVCPDGKVFDVPLTALSEGFLDPWQVFEVNRIAAQQNNGWRNDEDDLLGDAGQGIFAFRAQFIVQNGVEIAAESFQRE